MVVKIYRNAKTGSYTINPKLWTKVDNRVLYKTVNSPEELRQFVIAGNKLIIRHNRGSTLSRCGLRYSEVLAKKDYLQYNSDDFPPQNYNEDNSYIDHAVDAVGV